MHARFRRHPTVPPAPSPSAEFLAAGEVLVDALECSLAAYVEWLVITRLSDQRAVTNPERVLVKERSQEIAIIIIGELRALTAIDVDKQRSTPLEIVRHFVPPMTELCRDLGLQPIQRDRFLIERFSNDVYDLTPANLAVIGDEVADTALVWGAAKAFEHKSRHRAH